MSNVRFMHKNEVFTLDMPDHDNGLYFPVAGEQGIKSSLTPVLAGDSKLDQNTFIMEPVSSENLHNNKSTRNFWCHVQGKGIWSACGASAEAEYDKGTARQDRNSITAGFMWQTITRKSEKYQLKSEITSFVPLAHNVEAMFVAIENTADAVQQITPTAAIPIYGRSADNIRDHRHVTSLLHQIRTTEYGVEVKPKLSFDERGHQKNEITYFVYGVTGAGEAPEAFFPTVESFIGAGGSFLAPTAVRENADGVRTGVQIDGKEALGGLRFPQITLQPKEKAFYIILIGAEKKPNPQALIRAYGTADKAASALADMQKYWQNKVNVSFMTGNPTEDSYLRWICFQPILRRIYGCSFLPHHDYGKGGRGWRDLWQDCLSLLFMNPEGVRRMIVDNYGGVRMDGTNATIIGDEQGEFKADRNSITRVWMDHGFWPFLTTKLYIDLTGDIEILSEKISYFKDRQVARGTAVDHDWNDDYGMRQRTQDGVIYKGSMLEHILLQQLCAFYEVGEHNQIRLRNADWNDALDMAGDRGESVAFTSAYAYNLKELASYLEDYERMTGKHEQELSEPIMLLLAGNEDGRYDDIAWKHSVLEQYGKTCIHDIATRTSTISIAELASNLREKAEWMTAHIRQTEWVTDREGNGWFNGYYDNNGNQVEGVHGENVRMMLTSQVFSIMSGAADAEHIRKICRSADTYLYRKEAGGYRLNTKFDEDKFDLGRMFGFAYGEKENGAVFSHMTVMYANALYQQGFVKEGYKALSTLLETAMDFQTSRIYPGVPEYFDASGRGMYHYLTGAASWYMLTMITEAYGVKGELGSMTLAPKLMAEQFDENGDAAIRLNFLNKTFHIQYHNPQRLAYGEYKILKAECGGRVLKNRNGAAYLEKEYMEGLGEGVIEVHVMLG